MEKYYVGIDLGGTFIKGGIVTKDGEIVCQDKVPTEVEKGNDRVAENIAKLTETLLQKANVSKSNIVGIGLGSPGMIDSKKGVVVFSANCYMENCPLADMVSAKIQLPVKIANDANVAALGEVKFGAAKGKEDVVMITLGTGVGGGVVANGQLMEGNKSAGAELGHMSVVADGETCSCGRKGCMEAYSSATALIRDTKRAMQANKKSKMWEIGDLSNVTGKTAFDYKGADADAKAVVERYIRMLAVGLTNFANIFRPEVIILGGGVCAQGDELVKPVQALLNEDIFAGSRGPQVEIVTATLGNSAGLLGAAALWM